jgi:hypothetical protein
MWISLEICSDASVRVRHVIQARASLHSPPDRRPELVLIKGAFSVLSWELE